MGRVGMVLDLVAEFVMDRVCHGPSLLWVEMSRNRKKLSAIEVVFWNFKPRKGI